MGGDEQGTGTPSASTPFDGGEHTWVGDEEASAERLAERYLVQVELGRGAIGVVERVFDTHLDRIVARKRLLDDRPASRQRFVREARTTASLAHAGIPPVLDLGVDSNVPYYTMQEIVGRPWKELVHEAPDLEARLAQLDTLLVVARAIAHAHERRLVHRDVKLDNIMVGSLGDVFVVDWGLCVPVGHQGPPAGTPQYMSPEQARGEPVDERFDVWALGVLLFRLLTGEALYDGRRSSEVMDHAKAGRVPDLDRLLHDAPAELVDMVRKALAPEPDARYADAGAFAADLRAFLQGNWVTAHDYTVRELAERLWLKHRRRLLVGGTLATLALASGISGAMALIEERDRARAAERERERQLAGALEAVAIGSPSDRWIPEAEVAAAQALQLDADRPASWGVLARHARTEHPTLAWSTALDCPVVAADAATLVVVCDGEPHVVTLRSNGEASRPRPIDELEPPRDGSTSLRYHLAGSVLARVEPRRIQIVRLGERRAATSIPSSQAATTSIEPGTRDSRGLLIRDARGELLWFGTHGDGPENLGRPGPGRYTIQGDQVYVHHSGAGVLRCTVGAMDACEPFLEEGWTSGLIANGQTVVAVRTKGGLTVAQAPTDHGGDLLTTPRRELPGDAGALTLVHLVGDHLAALRTDGDVDVWHIDSGAAARLPAKHLSATALTSLNGRLLVLGDRAEAWDLGSGIVARQPVPAGAVTSRRGVPLTASAGRLTVHSVPPRHGPPPEDVVKDVDVLPNEQVVILSRDGQVQVWNPDTGEQTSLIQAHPGRRLVALGSGDVLLEDYERQILRVTPDGRVHVARGSCWGDLVRSEDRSAVVCAHDQSLQLLDPSTGDVVRELARHDAELWGVALSPDGGEATYALPDATLHRVDLHTGATRHWASGHDGYIPSLAYSPDGRFLATASWDQRAHVYDASTMTLRAVLEGHRGRVVEVSFPTPSELATMGWDHMMWRWDLSVLEETPDDHLTRVLGEIGAPP